MICWRARPSSVDELEHARRRQVAVGHAHAEASPRGPDTSASSKVTTSIPSCLNAGDARIRGTHCDKKASDDTRPPGSPSTQGASWPSWQRFGVMKEKFGVVAADARSPVSRSSPTTCVAHDGDPVIEAKYTKGS